MSIFTKRSFDIFAPTDSLGAPRGADMGEAQIWGTEVEAVINALSSGSALLYASKATLDADLAHAANTGAIVIGDATTSNNGWYRKSGASGSGSWVRVGDVPGYSFILASNVGAGTANAIVAITPSGIPAGDGGALIALPIVETNTNTPVTVSFDDGAALTIKTNSGNNPATGGLVSGMILAGYKSGSTFRLLSDQASAAIQSAAEAAQTAAETARDEAQAAAASAEVNLPATRADIDALDTATVKNAIPQDDGMLFVWDSSDLSGSLVRKSFTSDSVDSGTGVVTKTAHGLFTGNVVMLAAATNGLNANTRYWIIRDSADTFKLATSWANARAGTPVTLSAANAMTFKELKDPLGGIYRIPTGLSLDGSDGAWVRKVTGDCILARWFGDVNLDGSVDLLEVIMGAISMGGSTYPDSLTTDPGWPVRFDAGVWGFNPGTNDYEEIYISHEVSIIGAGVEKTVFKNLSAAGKGITFERQGSFGANPGNNSNYVRSGGFTLDMNDSTGRGLYHGGGQSQIGDIYVKNFNGADDTAPGIHLQGGTLTEYGGLWTKSTFGAGATAILLEDLFYANFSVVHGQASAGRGLKALNCVALSFDKLYVETDEYTGARGNLLVFKDCEGITVLALASEIAGSHTNPGLHYFDVDGCINVHILSQRVFNFATLTGQVLWLIEGGSQNVTLGKAYWHDAKTGQTFLRIDGSTNKQIKVHDVLTNIGASCLGVHSGGTTSGLTIENWVDLANVPEHNLNANHLRCIDIPSAAITIASSNTDEVIEGCQGTITGNSLTTLLRNCGSADQMKQATGVSITSSGGAFTSASVAAYYKRIDKALTNVFITLTITTAGSASGTIQVTGLPFTAAAGQGLIAIAGSKVCSAIWNGTTLSILAADGATSVIADGVSVIVTGVLWNT